MSVSIDLSGKIALITGASQGIGAAIARALHSAGAFVWINHPDLGTSRADADLLSQSLNETREQSSSVLAADVRKPPDVQGMMHAICGGSGGLDILVNNAGILRDRTISRMTMEEWAEVIETNLTGVFLGCKFGLEILRDGGTIINVGSLSAEAGFHGQSNYAAAKAGVHALSRVLSRECSRRKIRVNSIAPGVIDTPLMQAVSEEVRAKMISAIPVGRFGTPNEVASAVLFLASDLASYINGHSLKIDGGWRG